MRPAEDGQAQKMVKSAEMQADFGMVENSE